MPISINGKNYDIAYGTIPIESMGGPKLTYSMYGDEIPIKDEAGNIQGTIQITSSNSIYLKANGDLYVVGANTYGQLGLPAATSAVFEFTYVASNVKYAKLMTNRIFYVDKSNNLYAAGRNNYGQLGTGDIENKYSFTKIGNYPNFKSLHQLQDEYVTFMSMENGDVFAVGEKSRVSKISENTYDDHVASWVKLFSNVKKIYGQMSGLLYTDNNDNLYGVGYNGYSFGDGTNTDSKIPVLIKENVDHVDYHDQTAIMIKTKDNQLYMTGSSTKSAFNVDGKILHICDDVKDYIPKSGYSTVWARNNNNELFGGGQNTYGNMGANTTASPVPVAKRAENVLSYHVTGLNSWYIDNNNDLYGCGNNAYGSQGANTTTNKIIKWTKRAENVKQVYACVDNTFYLTFDGDLYVCGRDGYGLLGGIANDDLITFELLSTNVKRILNVFWGAGTIIFETNDNKLIGTGANNYGGYGLGGNSYNAKVNTLSEIWNDTTKIKEIVWGSTVSDNALSSVDDSYIITTDNEIYCTGTNKNGGFATGDKTSTGKFTKMNLPE